MGKSDSKQSSAARLELITNGHHSNRKAADMLERAEAIIALGNAMKREALDAVRVPPPGAFVFGPFGKRMALAVVRCEGDLLMIDHLTNAGMQPVPSTREFWSKFEILQVGDAIDEGMQRAIAKWQEEIFGEDGE